MNSTCSICEKPEFKTITQMLEIACDIHSDMSHDSLGSFKETFSKILGMDQETLTREIRRRMGTNAFKRLKYFEYGRNLINVDTGMDAVQNLAWIGCLAEASGRNIIVFCDFLCLNSLHQGEDAVLIKPSLPSTETPVACFLSSINIYHPIVESEVLIGVWNRLEDAAIQYLVDPNDLDIDDQVPVEAEEFVEDSARDLEIVDGDNDLTAFFDVHVSAIELSNARTTGDPVPEDSQTLDQFFANYYPNGTMADITSAAYTSTSSLNILDSQQSDANLTITKTYDLDGFFGYFPIESFGDIIGSQVRINPFPSFVDKRTMKTIKRLMDIAPNRLSMAAIVGSITISLGKIDLIAVMDFHRSVDGNILSTMLKECADYARDLPCTSETEHYATCISKTTRDSFLSSRRASPATLRKNETEMYGFEVAKCYFYHFEKALRTKLEFLDFDGSISIFFKSVGTKAATYSASLSGCMLHLEAFRKAVDYTKMDDKNFFIDFAITASAVSSVVDDGAVNIK